MTNLIVTFFIFSTLNFIILLSIKKLTMWKNHPKALPFLFFSEMWERFGYYLMIGIFTLYLKDSVAGFNMDEKDSASLYGTFIALVFFTPFLGGLIADRVGRRAVLGVSAVLIGAYSGFAPQLLGAGQLGEAVYMLGGFVLLGLAFGQSSGVVNATFSPNYRYTGAAIVANSAWFIGAGFAPLVALFLATNVGLWSVGLYLLSGVIGTLGALYINREWASGLS